VSKDTGLNVDPVFVLNPPVPDGRRRIQLEVVLVRHWVNWGSGNLEGGGFGERVGTGEVSCLKTAFC
jgi:hypothetical protein